jgi:hypothetical protein
MTQYAIFIQEGFGLDGTALYFTNEAPTYETVQIPVVANFINEELENEKVQVGEREETFICFTPLNGPYRIKGRPNRMPFHRVLSVVEQPGNSESEGD